MLSAQKVVEGPLLFSGSSDINGSVVNDTVVQGNSSLHIRGSVKGSLTIERGANVIVEGSIDGKVINNGGRLVVNNREIAEFVKVDGPPEAELGGVLKIDLTAIASNWLALTKHTAAECAGVVKADAYGCGIGPVTAALALAGCKTFFVANLAEARRVRAVAPRAVIYVLSGLPSGAGPLFVEINARPVINSPIEMAEWDVFAAANRWTGGFALNVVTGAGRFGLLLEEATAIAARAQSSAPHGIALLMSHLDNPEKPDHPLNHRQIGIFQDLRRLYGGVPASLANSSGIFVGTKVHYDLVRPGSALFGANPTQSSHNPMLPVLELRARILQIRTLQTGETLAYSPGWIAKRPTRIAFVGLGYADGYPRLGGASSHAPYAIVGGKQCRIAGRAAMDLLAIDVSELSDQAAARQGEMVTLIGGEVGIDDLAAAAKTTAGEVLCHLGQRLQRIYHAN
jgi:alanine racemase